MEFPPDQKPRKKFAKPPVKNACLACRASRTRCDGKDTCTTCLTKGKECRYTSSKRGGPRFSKRNAAPSKDQGESNADVSVSPATPFIYDDEFFLQASTFGGPGAGLRNLDNPVTFDFEANILWNIDSLGLGPAGMTSEFSNENFERYNTSTESPSDGSYIEENPLDPVRAYGSDEAILAAYYCYMHAYFPVLPPPLDGPAVDRPSNSRDVRMSGYRPSSPLCLAILAVLSLIPCADDPQPRSSSSVQRRREQSQEFAQRAVQFIEAESELAESVSSPSLALQNSEPVLQRPPFHSNTPVQLESILALLLLSVYEYCQRGNLTKMRSRAAQALAIAMDLELYKARAVNDRYSEARSRAWWMTYISVCQGSITSNTRPTLVIYDPRFTIAYPTTATDYEAWGLMIKAEQAILAATQFVIDLNECLESGKAMSDIYMKMQRLESEINPLISAVESRHVRSGLPTLMYPTEDMVVKSMRQITRIKLNSARIKVHRYCAFQDMAIFSQRHCDLKSIAQPESRSPDQETDLVCCQDSIRDLLNRSPDANSQARAQTQTHLFRNTPLRLPFTASFSANICRISALAIAEAFSNLPIPNPSGSIDVPSSYLTPSTGPTNSAPYRAPSIPTSKSISNLIPTPRTMPSFACCAMQSAYAMLLLCYKAHAIPLPNSTPESAFVFSDAGSGIELLMRSYVDQLTQGLRVVLGALENYSTAFEAIDGMRDQVSEALTAALASFEGDGLDGGADDAVQDWHNNGAVDDMVVNGGWSS